MKAHRGTHLQTHTGWFGEEKDEEVEVVGGRALSRVFHLRYSP